MYISLLHYTQHSQFCQLIFKIYRINNYVESLDNETLNDKQINDINNLKTQYIEKIKNNLPEMPESRRERYLNEYANLDELKAHYTRGGLGDVKVKRFLNEVIQAELAPIRARRKELMKDIPYVYEVLKKGSEFAEEKAAATLARVKDAMKINYFDDEELIRSQAEELSKLAED